jgi:hypothetical protein
MHDVSTDLTNRRTVLKTIAGAGIGGAAIAGASGTAAASDYDWEVDASGGKDFTTIQAAVDASEAGETIKVHPGEYPEQVVLYHQHGSDDLTLVGDPGQSDELGPGSDAPVVRGDGVDADGAAGFRLGQKSGVTVKGFEVTGFRQSGWGTGVKGGYDDITVADNYLHGLSANGVGRSGWGHVDPGSFLVERNLVENVGHTGIRLDNVADSTVRHNEVRGGVEAAEADDDSPRIGIHLHINIGDPSTEGDETTGVTATGNRLSQNAVSGTFDRAGIQVLSINRNYPANEPSTEAVISGLTVDGNSLRVPDSWGLLLAANPVHGETARIENVDIDKNDIQDSRLGLGINRAKGDDQRSGYSEISVEQNTFEENTYGSYVGQRVAGDEVTISANNIADNEKYGLLYAGDPELAAERNYWGSPQGPTRENPAGKEIGNGDQVGGNVAVVPWSPQRI